MRTRRNGGFTGEAHTPAKVMGKKRRLVKQYGNKIGYWSGKGENREFIALTNFGVRILKFVEAPAQLPDYKGFLVGVTQDRKTTAVKG